MDDFNPRTRTGYDPKRVSMIRRTEISIHVPARGTTRLFANPAPVFTFQSTYPHGVRRTKMPIRPMVTISISIHVPARGTTLHQRRPHHGPRISIHVPARGTTIDRAAKQGIRYISIHVPHGVRPIRGVHLQLPSYFNPRTRTGYDRLVQAHSLQLVTFQSTYPHGVRHQ